MGGEEKWRIMTKKLIVNADDFGIHPAVNEAVCRGFDEGILTSTSLMAGGDAFEEAVSLAKERKNLGIAVHLTLVGGIRTVLPPEDVPSLTWEGGRLCRDYMDLIRRDRKGLIRAGDVYREWDAQIQTVLGTGLPVTHLDGHQHMHMWPKFFKIALTLAEKYHIPCMRVPDENLFFGLGTSPFRYAAKNALTLLSRRNKVILHHHHIRTNDHFWGMLYGGHLSEDRMVRLVSSLEKGVNEIMCHPSADAAAMEETFHWGYHGDWELASLLSPKVKDLIEERQISLISYRDV